MSPRSTKASLLASAGCVSAMFGPFHQVLKSWLTWPSTLLNVYLLSLAMTLLYMSADGWVWTPLVFSWNCFVKPFLYGSSNDQQGRLNAFYAGQAHVYDKTRRHLLKGRETMLQLLAAHLKALPQTGSGSRKPRIWVDVGGGTGWNVEQMDEYLPLTYFDKIYVVDLCQPLLEVARERCRQKGWQHVEFLCQDASRFVIPEWESGQLDPRGSLSAITLSYSLSMIPTFYQLLDRCDQVLDPQSGLMGVVDFYTARSPDPKERAIGTQSKKMSRGFAWFWEMWFEMDGVHLHASRRDYLEYKMGTIKTYNGRNNFLNTYIISIPYYVFLGCSRRRDVSTHTKAFLEDAGSSVGLNQGGLLTPISPFMKISAPTDPADLPDFFTLGPSMLEAKGLEQTIMDMGAPLSPFHYQLRKIWRVPYQEEQVHNQFRTHIYGWVWEDPKVDVERLGINSEDSVLAITSAGDNVLHYALAARCKTIHAVDMNPCQGHILELKLAAIHTLEYSDFWLMFGEGKHPGFEKLLTTKLSPYLSSHAYAYWKAHANQFSRNFYFRGYSGWALRVSQIAFALAAVRCSVKKLCLATSVEEQESIWRNKLRPVLLNKLLMKGFLGNPMFNWHALGVPQNQMNCFLKDGTIEDFVKATFDPIAGLTTLKDDNYFYYLCLNGRYSRSSCPSYLKPEGFQSLKSAGRTNTFKLHTDTILNVLRGLSDGSLTKIIVMDSMDWFDPVPASRPLPNTETSVAADRDTPEAALENLKSELDYEILEMKRVLSAGGHVVWRSAGKYPWYIQRFELAGFAVEAVDIREGGKAIDRVNFYASLYRAKKLV